MTVSAWSANGFELSDQWDWNLILALQVHRIIQLNDFFCWYLVYIINVYGYVLTADYDGWKWYHYVR